MIRDYIFAAVVAFVMACAVLYGLEAEAQRVERLTAYESCVPELGFDACEHLKR